MTQRRRQNRRRVVGPGTDRIGSTPPGSTPPPRWSETESEAFLSLGAIFTPWRDVMAEVLCDLIPAGPGDEFVVVDIGAGSGWLSKALLEAFPRAHVIALDGSAAMLEHARQLLAPFGERAEVRPFELESPSWLQELTGPVRCFLSCLVIHHLEDGAKRELLRALHRHLEPGGAVLIADIVRPSSEWGRRHAARAWDQDARRRSVELTGALAAYETLARDRWNWFEHPDDPMDKPATLLDQLQWLVEAGFTGVDVFWARAGHAIFGGFR